MRFSTSSEKQINKNLLWETVVCALVVLCTLLNQTVWTSILFSISVILVVWHMLLTLRTGVNSIGALALLLSLTVLIIACFGALSYNVPISFEYFTVTLIFISTILLLCIVANVKMNAVTALFYLKANLIISFLFPIAYFFFTYEDIQAGLTLNFSNQNLLALWLMLYVLYACLSLIGLRGWWRAVSAVSIGINIYLIILTKCRNVVLSLVLLAVLFLIVKLKRKLRFRRWFLLVLILLPLIFIPLYLWLIQPIIDKGWLSFWISEGKPLNSRVHIWKNKFEILGGHWLLGFYANVMMRGNMHNMYMVVLCAYGVPVLSAVIIYLYKVVESANKKIKNSFQMYALCAFFAVLFMGIAEGALFSGGLCISLPAVGILYLANSEFSLEIKEDETIEQKKPYCGKHLKTRR